MRTSAFCLKRFCNRILRSSAQAFVCLCVKLFLRSPKIWITYKISNPTNAQDFKNTLSHTAYSKRSGARNAYIVSLAEGSYHKVINFIVCLSMNQWIGSSFLRRVCGSCLVVHLFSKRILTFVLQFEYICNRTHNDMRVQAINVTITRLWSVQ